MFPAIMFGKLEKRVKSAELGKRRAFFGISIFVSNDLAI
jgi:hypothetical protein